MKYSFECEALQTDISTTAAVIAAMHRRWIAVSGRHRTTLLALDLRQRPRWRHSASSARPSSNCPSGYRQQKNPRRQNVFAGVYFSCGGRSARQCVYLEVHISSLPMYTGVYISRTLRKTRYLKQTRIGYIRLLTNFVITTPTAGSTGLASARNNHEVRSKELDHHS